MPLARACSECGKSLAGYAPQAKTCGPGCRQIRARRERALKQAAGRDLAKGIDHTSSPMRALYDIVERKQTDVVKKVVEEQLAPIVRDALTESTLQAIQKLLGLTEASVDALAEDLNSDDAVIRQRAYSLAIKYTIGHPALVQSDPGGGAGQMVVNFNLPRPDSIEAEVIEGPMPYRTCDLCGTEKPQIDFVGSSDRCVECQERWKREITEQFA